MGKKTVITIFLAVFSYALFYALNTDLLNLNSSIAQELETPRLQLENFSIRKFEKQKKRSTINGAIGYFLDPNILKITGGMKYDSYDSNQKNTVVSNTITAYFDSNSISDLAENGTLLRTVFEGNVQFIADGRKIQTEYAEYLSRDNLITSLNPVKFIAGKSVVSGSNGFKYSIDKKVLNLFGLTTGEFFGEN